MNHLYLRRKHKVYVKAGAGGATVAHVAVVQKEAEHLGFVLSDRLVTRLSSLSIDSLGQFCRSLLKDLREAVGAHRTHEPLYPGFPEQVIRLSEAQLYLNAVSHYLNLRRMPCDEPDRLPLLHGKAPREVDLGSVEEFESIFTRLVSSKASLSEQDKADVIWFVKQYQQDIFRLLPDKVSFKENAAFVGAHLLRHVPGEGAEDFLRKQMKTATDVLRLAAAQADGDASLKNATKFKSIKRAQRKLLLGLIEKTGDPTEDMLRWAERWKRLGEVLHPGEFRARFPMTCAAFAVVRNGTPFRSFNSTLETLLDSGQTGAAGRLLLDRPGDFARRLDHLLRTAHEPSGILESFDTVTAQVSTPVLLQVLTHFNARGHRALRTFFPKGDVAKVFAMEDDRAPIPDAVSEQVAKACEAALLDRFAKLPSLGACFIDPELRHHIVPFSQRAASHSLRTLVRGSRIPMPDARFVRLFLWWMNGRGRTDIDLSAVLFGKAFDYVDALTYYKLKNYGGYHSGDIVDAPKGAAEFIDLDLERLRGLGVRFVVMVLNSYTLQPYCDLPECFAGWMARQDTNSGEVFEPRTVVDRVDIASDTRICLPLVFDLDARQVLWMDIALQDQPRWNNVHSNLSGVSLMLRALTSLVKTDLFTLFTLHARARGSIVDSPGGAQTVFSLRDGITPFDIDRVRSEFL